MSVLSPNHHSRHIDDPAEKASFFRTAPIETGADYWDVADEIHSPNPSAKVIDESQGKIVKTLQSRTHQTADIPALQLSIKYMDRVIDRVIRSTD